MIDSLRLIPILKSGRTWATTKSKTQGSASMSNSIFGYGRVSTTQQDTENQRLELEQAGWTFDFWFADIVSRKVQAIQRKAFAEICPGSYSSGSASATLRLLCVPLMGLYGCYCLESDK